MVEARQACEMACILSLPQTTNSAYWYKSWSFRGDRIQWNFLGQWCGVCWWYGAKSPAHTEDRDRVIYRNVRIPSHPDGAVCPRMFRFMQIKFTSHYEQCIWNLPQTTNSTQCNIVIMNHPLSLIIEIYWRTFSSSTLESSLKIPPIYILHLIFHTFVNPSSRRNFKIIVSVQASQISLSHEVFENKTSMLNCFFLSESLAVDFIIHLSCGGK
jgi:hypothetical protein